MASEGILLAVAVHDHGEARVVSAAPEDLNAQEGVPLTFRVSYALNDAASSREEAKVSALVTMEGQKPIAAEVKMRDRPVLDDTRLGDLVFEVPALKAGEHVLHFVVAIEATDTDVLSLGVPEFERAQVKGDVRLHVRAATAPPTPSHRH